MERHSNRSYNVWALCSLFITGIQKLAKLMLTLPRVTARQGGWKLHTTDVVVPDGVNGFKVGARCNAEINTGLIRVDQLSFTKYDVGCGIANIGGFFGNLLNPFSLLNAGNLFGWISSSLFGSVPVGAITDETPNLLTNPFSITALWQSLMIGFGTNQRQLALMALEALS